MGIIDQSPETPKWRMFWLLLGFAVLVGIGVVTVLLPELEDQRAEDSSGSAGTGGPTKTPNSSQE